VDFRVRNTRKPECAILYNLSSLADGAEDILFLGFFKIEVVTKSLEVLRRLFFYLGSLIRIQLALIQVIIYILGIDPLE
jgi:hypothetical protein